MHIARALIALTFITGSALAAPPQRPELDLSAMADLPPEVIAVGAVQSLTLLERDLTSYGMANVAQSLFASDYASAIDENAPVRAALIDPAKYGVGIAVVVELKKDSALLKRITAKNWERILDANEATPTYIDSIGGNRVVVTLHPQMFQIHAPFFKKLAGWKPKAPYLVDAHVGNAANLYQSFLEGFGSVDDEDALMMIEGLARLSFAFELGSDYPRATVGMTAVRGSKFEQEFVNYDGPPVDKLLDEVPADAWFVGATTLPKGLVEDVDDAVATFVELMTPSSDQRSAAPNKGQESAQLRSLLETVSRLTKGRHILWSSPRNTVTLNWLIESQDANALHAVTVDLLEFTLMQALSAAASAGHVVPQTVDQALQAMAMVAMTKGMQLMIADNHAVPRASVIGATIDWSKLLGQPKNSQPVDYARRVVGDVWSWSLASNGKRAALVFSPDAPLEAKAVAAGPPTTSFRKDPWAIDAARNETFAYVRLDILARYLPRTDRDGRKLATALELMTEPVVATSRIDKGKGKRGMSSRTDFTVPRSVFNALVTAF